MYFTTHIFSPNNTGAPDYDICGQGAAIVNFTNLTFKVAISKDGSAATTIINTTNLVGETPGSFTPVNIDYGDYTINFNSWAFNAGTGSITMTMNVYVLGTTTPVSWEKFNLHLYVAKSGYQSYSNVVELYNYDVGNDATLGHSGNQGFNLYLVNDTNNVVDGQQYKVFANYANLRRPFTDEVHLYRNVSGQGVFNWYETTASGDTLLGTGDNLTICHNARLTGKLTVTLTDSNCEVLDECTLSKTLEASTWLPTMTVVSSCPDSCGECSNNAAPTTVSATLDWSEVSSAKFNGTTRFFTEYLEHSIIFNQYNSSGILQGTQETELDVTYTEYTDNPSLFGGATPYEFTPEDLGDNVVSVSNWFGADLPADDSEDEEALAEEEIMSCTENVTIPTCNWWTIETTTTCGKYTFKNCSALSATIVLQQLQEDKTFSDVLEIETTPFSDITIELEDQGIYLIKVPSLTEDGVFEYYTIVNYCDVESCWLSLLAKILCTTPTDDCSVEDYANFNSFLINAHTLFMMLNEEFNFSYIYTSLSDDKITNLYDMKTLLDKMSEYCTDTTKPCTDCE